MCMPVLDQPPFSQVYTYSFEEYYPGVEVAAPVYVSGTEEHSRGKPTKCDETPALPAKLAVGVLTPCWKPTPTAPADLVEMYNCGNPSCMKVQDPAEALGDRSAAARTLWLVGAILLGVGLPCFCVMAGGAHIMRTRAAKRIGSAKLWTGGFW